MKRMLNLMGLAFLAWSGLASMSYAGGAFGLFYCPKYCSSYCQAACPHNAFSCPTSGCCGQSCGGGGCGYGKAPFATHLVSPTPQHFDPICTTCGMNSYGLGGVRGHGWPKKCKGGKCKGVEGDCYGGSCAGLDGNYNSYPMFSETTPSYGTGMSTQLANYYPYWYAPGMMNYGMAMQQMPSANPYLNGYGTNGNQYGQYYPVSYNQTTTGSGYHLNQMNSWGWNPYAYPLGW